MAERKQGSRASRTEAVRSAAAQAMEATAEQAQQTRDRAQALADELLQAAARMRGALDELRPASADDVKALARRLDDVEKRLTKLESPAKPRPRTAAKRAAAKKGNAE
jgi:polyhydroxyalkanoate synthesis regulator phasin